MDKRGESSKVRRYPPGELKRRVLQELGRGQKTFGQLYGIVQSPRSSLYSALGKLVREGRVAKEGKGKKAILRLTNPLTLAIDMILELTCSNIEAARSIAEDAARMAYQGGACQQEQLDGIRKILEDHKLYILHTPLIRVLEGMYANANTSSDISRFIENRFHDLLRTMWLTIAEPKPDARQIEEAACAAFAYMVRNEDVELIVGFVKDAQNRHLYPAHPFRKEVLRRAKALDERKFREGLYSLLTDSNQTVRKRAKELLENL